MKTIKYLSKPLNKHGFVEGRQDYCLEDTVWFRQKGVYRVLKPDTRATDNEAKRKRSLMCN